MTPQQWEDEFTRLLALHSRYFHLSQFGLGVFGESQAFWNKKAADAAQVLLDHAKRKSE